MVCHSGLDPESSTGQAPESSLFSGFPLPAFARTSFAGMTNYANLIMLLCIEGVKVLDENHFFKFPPGQVRNNLEN
jgi:hypothetical protein